MRLTELVAASGALVTCSGQAEVLRPIADSRQAQPGDLFVCMPSDRRDTHELIPEAVEAGASAVMLHSPDGARFSPVPCLAASPGDEPFREAVWRLAHTLVERPSAAMKVIGVTGTNGKTTTAWLLRDLLQAVGMEAGYLGTLGYQSPLGDVELSNTTPFAVDLANLLAQARTRGTTAVAIEVSSHALEERRADGVEFDAAVFTNLTQDHLDYHGSMESYAAAKWRLFSDLPLQTSKPFVAALNVDDPCGADFSRRASVPVVNYSMRPADGVLSVNVGSIELERLELSFSWRGATTGPVQVPLGGSFNVVNTLSAVAGMIALGYELEATVAALPSVRPVPGRFEAISNDRGIGIIVDYAHTPDALEKLLDAVRGLKPSRVISVFGCGGDRDRTKRPLMARAASERSDLTVVTSDNPRTEDAQAILDEVRTGITAGQDSVAILDRRDAVAYAVAQAGHGDVVVIAGKGHENYQIIGHTKYPMDDRDLARAGLEARK
jgi:UDP-N-acetylmuramoyl-L-alanyl-D-glutamate--2,6-diaminopimelate ligase